MQSSNLENTQIIFAFQASYVAACLNGFTAHTSGCHKLFPAANARTPQELMETCASDYGVRTHLVAVETQQEKEHMEEMVAQSGNH